MLPLGPRSGLIQWVQHVTPLFSIYKSWQLRSHAAAALRDKSTVAPPGGANLGAPPSDDASGAAVLPVAPRPAELYFAKLAPVLKSKGLTPNSPRKDWPHELLRRVLQELIAETPRELIAQVGSCRLSWCDSGCKRCSLCARVARVPD